MVCRAAVYVEGQGVVLGPPKTAGAAGTHHLGAGVVELLGLGGGRRPPSGWRRTSRGRLTRTTAAPCRRSSRRRPADSSIARRWPRRITRAAERAGLDPAGLSTHTGRRTAVTVLYAEAGLDLSDIARYVGHASEATTVGYVRALGERPKATAATAAAMLDPRSARRSGA